MKIKTLAKKFPESLTMGTPFYPFDMREWRNSKTFKNKVIKKN